MTSNLRTAALRDDVPVSRRWLLKVAFGTTAAVTFYGWFFAAVAFAR
jgi:hypothetical protein